MDYNYPQMVKAIRTEERTFLLVLGVCVSISEYSLTDQGGTTISRPVLGSRFGQVTDKDNPSYIRFSSYGAPREGRYYSNSNTAVLLARNSTISIKVCP